VICLHAPPTLSDDVGPVKWGKILICKKPKKSDIVGVKQKQNKTEKIDVRLEPDLFAEVDSFAKANRISRSQVVQKALLKYFGHHLPSEPSEHRYILNEGNGTFEPWQRSDGGLSTQTTPNSRQAG
jgi:hypothetical protein